MYSGNRVRGRLKQLLQISGHALVLTSMEGIVRSLERSPRGVESKNPEEGRSHGSERIES